MKRIVLFLVTNLAVMLVLSVVAVAAGRRTAASRPTGSTSACCWCSPRSWASAARSSRCCMSKTDGEVVHGRARDRDAADRRRAVARGHGAAASPRRPASACPRSAIFEGAPNAFATGAFKNSSLVAVSTGLLQSMTREEVEAVLGHEVAHVANGDMVTLTLIQGVVNTFVVFLARVVGYVVDKAVFKTERGIGPGYYITVIVCEIVFGILASIIVAWFSRQREFRADAGSAGLHGHAAPDDRRAAPPGRPRARRAAAVVPGARHRRGPQQVPRASSRATRRSPSASPRWKPQPSAARWPDRCPACAAALVVATGPRARGVQRQPPHHLARTRSSLGRLAARGGRDDVALRRAADGARRAPRGGWWTASACACRCSPRSASLAVVGGAARRCSRASPSLYFAAAGVGTALHALPHRACSTRWARAAARTARRTSAGSRSASRSRTSSARRSRASRSTPSATARPSCCSRRFALAALAGCSSCAARSASRTRRQRAPSARRARSALDLLRDAGAAARVPRDGAARERLGPVRVRDADLRHRDRPVGLHHRPHPRRASRSRPSSCAWRCRGSRGTCASGR